MESVACRYVFRIPIAEATENQVELTNEFLASGKMDDYPSVHPQCTASGRVMSGEEAKAKHHFGA